MPEEKDQIADPGMLEQWLKELEAYDSRDYQPPSRINPAEKLREIESKLVSAGSSAVPRLIEILHQRKKPGFAHAAAALGEIGDTAAISHLAKYLEDKNLGEDCKNALVRIGPESVPEIIETMESRIANPITENGGFISLTHFALAALGKIKCHPSAAYLNRLLDDYMEALPSESFNPFTYDWPYRNVDLFHLLDCMVKQQDKSSITHIKKAQEHFPPDYTEFLVCQIAAGRIEEGSTEGYLPLEALNLAIPDEDPVEDLLASEMETNYPMDDDFNLEKLFGE